MGGSGDGGELGTHTKVETKISFKIPINFKLSPDQGQLPTGNKSESPSPSAAPKVREGYTFSLKSAS